MFISQSGDFSSVLEDGMSFYCMNHGYMGGENAFTYLYM